MNEQLKALYDKMKGLVSQAREIIDAADSSDAGTMTAEQQEQHDKIMADYEAAESRAKSIEYQVAAKDRIDQADDWLGKSAPTGVDKGKPQQMETDSALELKLRGETMRFNPGTPLHHAGQPGYRKAFADFLSGGIVAGLQTNKDPYGGFLVPTQMSMEILAALDDAVVMRQLGRVLPPLSAGSSLGVPTLESNPGDSDWTTEVPSSAISEDTSMTFGKRELAPHLLTKLVKVSRKMLRSSAVNIEAYVRERLAYVTGLAEDKGFLTGDGADQPLGIFTASDDGIGTGRDVTTTSAAAIAADDLTTALYTLKGQYQNNATWLFHRDAIRRIRQLKDGNGQYLWQPGLQAGVPGVILGRPYVMSENAPNTFSTTEYIGMVADFSYYWIVDALNIELQRLDEAYATTNQVGFIARKETDGMPVLAEAFVRIKLL